MRAALLFAMPFVASASQAVDEFGKMLLMARQDQSFVPTVGGSVTCLPPNSICGRYCKIVSKRDVCCPENCRSSLSKRLSKRLMMLMWMNQRCLPWWLRRFVLFGSGERRRSVLSQCEYMLITAFYNCKLVTQDLIILHLPRSFWLTSTIRRAKIPTPAHAETASRSLTSSPLAARRLLPLSPPLFTYQRCQRQLGCPLSHFLHSAQACHPSSFPQATPLTLLQQAWYVQAWHRAPFSLSLVLQRDLSKLEARY